MCVFNQLLYNDESFRKVTLSVIGENLFQLLTNHNDKVPSGLVGKIEDLFQHHLTEIRSYLLNKLIKDQSYGLIEAEWENYIRTYPIPTERLVSDAFIVLPFNLGEKISGFSDHLKMGKTVTDSFQRKLFTFFILHDLRANLNKDNAIPIGNGFPLPFPVEDLELFKSYQVESEKLELINCGVKFGLNGNYVQYYMFVKGNKVYFSQPDIANENNLVVRFIFYVRMLEVYTDSTKTKELSLNLVDTKHKFAGVKLEFDTFNEASKIKTFLEESRNDVAQKETKMAVDYFRSLK